MEGEVGEKAPFRRRVGRTAVSEGQGSYERVPRGSKRLGKADEETA